MSEIDFGLLKMAQSASRYDYEFIEGLIPMAESEECRDKLTEKAHWAFKRCEMREFDV